MKKNKEQYYQKLDTYLEMIPLTLDSVFKTVMQLNSNVFKRFLIETLDLDIKPEESNVIFVDKELIKEKYKEKGKIVDLNVKINENLLVTVEINRVRFESVKLRNKLYLEKLRTMQLEIGDEYNILDSKYIYQLNLNANDKHKGKGENIIVSYDITNKEIYDDTEKIYIKHLEFYRKMFYTNPKEMKYDEYFMAGMMAKNFTELYNIFKNILNEKELNKFMGSMINMSKEWVPIHEWEKEKMEKMVREKEREIAAKEGKEKGIKEGKKEGINEGIKEGINEMIISMLNNNIDIETVSKVSNKSIEEIKKIEQSIKD